MCKQLNYLLLTLSLVLTGCTGSIVQYGASHPVDLCAKFAIVPFSNYTETPLAGERAMSITAAELESFGINKLAIYQNQFQGKVLFPGMNRVLSQKSLQEWAQKTHARYMLTGSVNEWSYKVGLDGEPVVGIALQLIDLKSGRTVWSAVASKSGGSRIAVSTTAQETIKVMLKGLVASHQPLVR